MKIEMLEEHEDGSATVTLELDKDEHQALVHTGFEFLLRQIIKEAERSKALQEAFEEEEDRA